jgi:hypothetical protein
MDVRSDVLRTIQLEGALFLNAELAPRDRGAARGGHGAPPSAPDRRARAVPRAPHFHPSRRAQATKAASAGFSLETRYASARP